MTAQEQKEIEDAGKKIANILVGVETDYRGDVLLHASTVLRENLQNFTSTVLRDAAHHYLRG